MQKIGNLFQITNNISRVKGRQLRTFFQNCDRWFSDEGVLEKMILFAIFGKCRVSDTDRKITENKKLLFDTSIQKDKLGVQLAYEVEYRKPLVLFAHSEIYSVPRIRSY